VDADKKRRKATGVPQDIRFQTKPEIALQQIRTAVDRELPTAPVLANAAYGNDTEFREGITELGLLYILGIQSSVSVWKLGQAPLPKAEVERNRTPHQAAATRSTAHSGGRA
jgi:SRSO17 transposase